MTAAREGGGCVTEIKAVSRQGQYNYLLKVAQDCEQETAVLYRNNESALPIIDLLERKGLSYRVKNSDMTFFSHPVVNDICDLFSCLWIHGMGRHFFGSITKWEPVSAKGGHGGGGYQYQTTDTVGYGGGNG